MKILQISDTHWGITKRKAILRMLQEAAKKDFDLILHCGDYCGGTRGYRTTNATIRLIREVFPDKPYVSVLGNHDFWHVGNPRKRTEADGYFMHVPRKGFPAMATFQENLQKIRDCFEENNVHFLDTDGYYIHPDFPDRVLIGNSGWYNHPHPPTNDINFLPYGVEANTNQWMERNARHALYKQLDELDKIYETYMTICFVSHFPVIKARDYKGGFEMFSWDARIGDMIQETYNCKHFFCGHAHQFHNGPLRYEAGSDYCNPKFQIVEV